MDYHHTLQHVDDFHLAVPLFYGAQAPAVVQPAAHLLLCIH